MRESGLTVRPKATLVYKGVYKSKLGYMYDGQYKDNIKHGKGRFSYADGKVYEGDFVANKKHGNGV